MARPHPYQTTDSKFEVRPTRSGMFEVWETWWQTDRNGEQEDAEEWCASYRDRDAAEAERDRRAGT